MTVLQTPAAARHRRTERQVICRFESGRFTSRPDDRSVRLNRFTTP